MKCKVGYVWVFENIVVYGNPLQLGKRIRQQLGDFLGVVKGVIPDDPYYLLYERLKHTRSWKQRHPQQTLPAYLKQGEK
ncbi:MAG: hypothetical protein QXL54_03255 [Candidatus Bathyarchaeia archaeon]